MEPSYVYIMASMNNRALYIGSTNNLPRRVFEHKDHLVKGFTDKYNITKLVYFEEAQDITSAGLREKKLKNRSRDYKVKLIEKSNPKWRDLTEDFW